MWEKLKTQAQILTEKGNYAEAAELYSRIAEEAPDSDEKAAALINEHRCLEADGRFAEARFCLQGARSLGGQTREYVARLDYLSACLDAREGNAEIALEKLNDLLHEQSDVVRTPEGVDLYESIQIQRAECLANLNRMREAAPLFVEAQGFSVPKPENFEYRMALCLAKCGDFARAEAFMLRKLAGDLDVRHETSARYYLALIYASASDYAKALQELQFCESHLDESSLSVPSVLDALAYTCEKLGRGDDAARYRRASGRAGHP